MKRILVFTTAYHPAVGGAEITLRQVMRRTSDEYFFTVLTHRMDRSWKAHEFVDGVEVWRLGYGTALDRMLLLPFLSFWKAREIMRLQHFDLLWAMMVSYASIGAYLCKLFGSRVPLLLTLQEGDPERHLRYGKFGLLGLWWKRLVRSADYIQAISSFLADRAVRLGALGRVVIVPNGVDVEHFSRLPAVSSQERYRSFFKITPEQKIVITVSRLVRKNAVDDIIRALALLPQAYRLLIVGQGPEQPALATLAASLGVDQRVTFVGPLSHQELPDVLHLASVFVRPSRSEGLGNAFLESMAARVPVIGTAVGGIVDFLADGKTGLIVPPDSPESLAAQIIRVCDDSRLHRVLQENAAKLVQANYDWAAIAEQMKTVFAEALRLARQA